VSPEGVGQEHQEKLVPDDFLAYTVIYLEVKTFYALAGVFPTSNVNFVEKDFV